jgi:alpha-beta hydrolase superfamily lysophospholipase
MTPDNFTYESTDGRQLAGYRWAAPDGQTKAGVVVLVHGMGEHLRRYDHVAEALTSAGFVVYGHDHRGHGASLANGDEPGHLGPQGRSALVDDLNVVVAQAKSDHPGLPIVIVAHSMGSFATQQFLLDHGTDVDAVALTGTAALDLLEPALDLSTDLDLSAFNAPFQPARTDFDWLSRDESVVDAYLADPLCGFGIDAASARDMFTGARRLAEPSEVARLPDYLPLYIAVGSKDPRQRGARSSVGTGRPIPNRGTCRCHRPRVRRRQARDPQRNQPCRGARRPSGLATEGVDASGGARCVARMCND